MSDIDLDAIKVRIEAELPWLGGSDQTYYALVDRRDLLAEVERLTKVGAQYMVERDLLQAENERLTAELKSVRVPITLPTSVSGTWAALVAERDTAYSEVRRLQRAIDETSAENERLRVQLSAATKAFDELQGVPGKYKAERDEARAAVLDATEAVAAARIEVRDAAAQRDDARAEVKRLRTELESAPSYFAWVAVAERDEARADVKRLRNVVADLMLALDSSRAETARMQEENYGMRIAVRWLWTHSPDDNPPPTWVQAAYTASLEGESDAAR